MSIPKKLNISTKRKYVKKGVKNRLATEAARSTSGNVLLDDVKHTFEGVLAIMVKKNHDYAGAGGQDPFKNFKNSTIVGVSVQKGILVRVMDKVSRVSNLLDQPAAVENESIIDTLDDAIAYFAILKSSIKRNIK